MAFGSISDGDDESGELAEINMIPLIDVMLVLLVIFIVTAPLLTHAVKVDLPKASSAPNPTPPDSVQLAIDANSQVFWSGQAVDAGQLGEHLRAAAALTPQPELQLRAERTTPYEKVAEVMAASARAGLSRLGFVTEPQHRNN
ncbi:MAG TPA: biopolymer transporter ExbD [Rhodocyclaceae bacterium]|nr:biopolymer transporter ExbD [Rhodocyclaceae bacterium]